MRRLLYMVIALSGAGCQILNFDACRYELRDVAVEGKVMDGATELLFARIDLNEQRDYQPNKYMVWQLRGAPLKGHVTSATLRDSNDESKALYTFPIGSPAPDYISNGVADQRQGANLNGFFAVLSGGRAIVDVRTDIPGREIIKLTPPKVFEQDWTRPSCG